MSWKITLGKSSNPYIIGKRWVKKRYKKKDRISKSFHQETDCPGAIYDIGEHYLPESPDKRSNLWVCMTTGKLFKKSPKISPSRPKVSSRKVRPKAAKPKPRVSEKPKTKPRVEKQKEIPPEPEPEPVPTTAPATKLDMSTSVSEVKGIGKAAFEKLSIAGINSIKDLLKYHSQEIATLIGRKSDAQIKKWQIAAKSMID